MNADERRYQHEEITKAIIGVFYEVDGLRVWEPVAISTSTDMPGRSRWLVSLGCSTAIFTGTRWTTLVKFPVALSGGSSAKRAPVAGLRLSTRPENLRPG